MTAEVDKETLAEIRRAYRRSGPDSMPWRIAERFGLKAEDVLDLCDPKRRALAKAEEALRAEEARRKARAERRAGVLAKAAAELRAKEARQKARASERLARASERVARLEEDERRAKGEAKHRAEIRRRWAAGETGRSIAARFGIAPSKVSGIVADLPRPVRYAGPESAPRLPPLPKPAVPLPPPGPGDRLTREPTVRGSRHGRAMLDEAKVIEMRRLRSQGWSTGRLADRYGVSRNTACYAISGKTWGHVGPAPIEDGGPA